MQIKVFGSSSAGNFYTIEDQGEILLLEAGIKFKDIKKALNYNFKNVVGCLVTHGHGDHNCSIHDLMNFGVRVFASEPTFNNSTHYNKVLIQGKSRLNIGNYKIIAFDVFHDAEQPLGFAIETPSGKRILFATDTSMLMDRFNKINVYMLECNFDMDSMRKAVNSGKVDPAVLVRVASTHMSLETVLSYLNNVDLSDTDKIMLIHLSDSNSNESKYIETVKNQTGVETIAAKKGDVISYTEMSF